jgi:hypothetical protein
MRWVQQQPVSQTTRKDPVPPIARRVRPGRVEHTIHIDQDQWPRWFHPSTIRRAVLRDLGAQRFKGCGVSPPQSSPKRWRLPRSPRARRTPTLPAQVPPLATDSRSKYSYAASRLGAGSLAYNYEQQAWSMIAALLGFFGVLVGGILTHLFTISNDWRNRRMEAMVASGREYSGTGRP